MNKNESRYFNTAVRMDNALISILEKKDFEYITIKEICDAAGVNRSTFYLHYENTADLLNEATQYILDRFFSYFSDDAGEVTERLKSCSLHELIFITPEYITPYLTFIKENQRLFITSIRKFGSMGFGDVYNELFINIFDPILSRFSLSETERIYVIKFYLMGITAVVMEWLENSCEESIEQICRIIIDCIIGKRDAYDQNV